MTLLSGIPAAEDPNIRVLDTGTSASSVGENLTRAEGTQQQFCQRPRQRLTCQP